MGGRRGGVGRGGGWGSKTPQLKTWGHQSLSDGPDHSTRPKGHHSGQGYNFRLITPIGVLHRCQCVGHGFTRL